MQFHSSLVYRFNILKLYNEFMAVAYIPFLFVFFLLGISRSMLLTKG